MPAQDPYRLQRWLLGIIATVLVLVLLVQARFFLIPLAIAILLFSLTSAAISLVARQKFWPFAIPTWLASMVAVLMIAAGLLALFGIISAQTNTIIASADVYAVRGQEAVAALFLWLGDDVAAAVLDAFQDIDFGSYLRAFAGSAGNLLMATVLIILYVGFLFAERPWFEAKLARLFPEPERAREVDAILTAIGRSVRHYVLIKTAVSIGTAAVVFAILVMFGLDFAGPLALMSFLLNFIPNIGSMVATALPTVVALVQFGDWSSALMVLLAVGAAQFAIGNVLDPMLMGRTLHLSSFAIIISLTFWGAIWGVVGLFLAVPIMVMVMIVCSHVPALQPIAVLLSRQGIPAGADGAPADPRPEVVGAGAGEGSIAADQSAGSEGTGDRSIVRK